MRLVICGTPGTGKTTIARLIGKQSGHRVLNELAFAKSQGIGKFDQTGELVVPLSALTRKLNAWLKTHPNAIVEGHLVCECPLRPINGVLVVHVSPERLEFRLRKRGYPEVKIQDNVLCEGIDYCLKHAKRNYPKSKIKTIRNEKELKHTIPKIIKLFSISKKRGKSK